MLLATAAPFAPALSAASVSTVCHAPPRASAAVSTTPVTADIAAPHGPICPTALRIPSLACAD
jgi:hypothetical protein